jgi:hypothetical protein
VTFFPLSLLYTVSEPSPPSQTNRRDRGRRRRRSTRPHRGNVTTGAAAAVAPRIRAFVDCTDLEVPTLSSPLTPTRRSRARWCPARRSRSLRLDWLGSRHATPRGRGRAQCATQWSGIESGTCAIRFAMRCSRLGLLCIGT